MLELRHFFRSVLSFSASAAALLSAVPALGADLALKRVLLGTGGVGYFEYAAEVDAGDSSLNLRARLDQVDDILKSLIVIDPAGPATATLPGKRARRKPSPRCRSPRTT